MRVPLEYLGDTFFSGPRTIQEPRLSEAALDELIGLYRSSELKATYKASLDKGDFVLRNGLNPTLKKLSPIAPDEFESDLGTIVFRRDANHHVSGLSLFVRSGRNLSFERAN